MSCIYPYHHAQFMGYDQHLMTFRAGSRSRVSMTQHRILHLWYTYGTNLRVAQFSRLRTVLLLVDDHCLRSVVSQREYKLSHHHRNIWNCNSCLASICTYMLVLSDFVHLNIWEFANIQICPFHGILHRSIPPTYTAPLSVPDKSPLFAYQEPLVDLLMWSKARSPLRFFVPRSFPNRPPE